MHPKTNPRELYEFLTALKPAPWRLHGIFHERGKLPDPLPDWWYVVQGRDGGKDRPASMHNVFASTLEDIERFVAQCTEARLNAYYAANRGVTRDRDTGERRKDFPHKLDAAEITHLDFLQLDLDLKAVPDDVLALPDDERLQWYARQKRGLHARIAATIGHTPTFVVDTGGGLQVLLKVAEPLEVTDPDEAAGYNKALESLFPEADATHDVCRIFRCPGTINWPDEKKRERGRVPVPARVLQHEPAATINLAAITPLAVEAKTQVAVTVGVLIRVSKAEDLDEHADERLLGEARYERLKVLMTHGYDPEAKEQKPSSSEPVFDFVCNSIRCGLPDELIVGVVTDSKWPISRHVLSQSNPERYAVRQIEQALRKGVERGEHIPGQMIVCDGMVPFSEDHLADTFVVAHPDLRYCASMGRWFEWDDIRWRQDSKLHVFDLARGVAREASLLAPTPKVAAKIASKSTVAAIEQLSRADQRVAVETEVFDADPMLLNTPGGIVDLRTGELMPCDKEHYLTKATRVAPATGTPENFVEFLRTVTDGDDEYIAYLRRVCGYMLTGLTVEHALFFAHGGGGNGKSVLQETMLHILGDYAKTTSFNTLIVHGGGPQHPTDLAALRGARLVVAPETEANQRWAEAKIKQMTGGDTIAARFMRQDFFEYKPQFKLFVVGNHRPSFGNVDDAIRRRVHLLPFDVKIPRPDKHYKERRLFPEAGQILTWAIEGCLAWQEADGLQPPSRVADATSEYLTDQDTVGQWLAECTASDVNASERIADLYGSWARWCEEANERAGTKRALAQLLADRGYQRATGTGNVKLHRGLALTADERERLNAQERAARARQAKDRLIAGMAAQEALAEREEVLDGADTRR